MSKLNAETVQRRLRAMREHLDELDRLGEVSEQRLRTDWMVRAAAERVLIQIIELAVQINTHVVAASGRVAPTAYRESFFAAADAGVIPADVANAIAPSAGMRNILVHQYLDADLAIVAEAITRARTEYAEYVRQVAQWLAAQSG